MGHDAAIRGMGQASHLAQGNVVREESVQMVKRVLIVLSICISLLIVLSKRDGLIGVIDHPISSVKVSGAFSFLQETDVTKALSGQIGAGFIATDLSDVQSRVEALPWVHSATVSRVWPGELKITVHEQVAVSQWNQASLMNAEGVIYTPEQISVDLHALPLLIGSENYSTTKRVMMFSTLSSVQDGLTSWGLAIETLELKPRNVWNMTLTNGVSVAMGEISVNDRLGEQALMAKLERVGKVFSTHAGLDTQNIRRIDARYPNGVAIKWRTETK